MYCRFNGMDNSVEMEMNGSRQVETTKAIKGLGSSNIIIKTVVRMCEMDNYIGRGWFIIVAYERDHGRKVIRHAWKMRFHSLQKFLSSNDSIAGMPTDKKYSEQ